MSDISVTDRKDRKKGLLLLIMGAALIFIYLISFTFGRYHVPLGEVLRIIGTEISRGFVYFVQEILHIPLKADLNGMVSALDDSMYSAVINIRLPRITMAAFVGCCLSAAGASYQGVFQNPMAAPDILGASNGAAFGAALAILLNAPAAFVSVSAFVCSIVTVVVVFLIAQRAPGQKVINLILAGIMIGSLMSAGTSYIKLVADPADQLPKITYWLMGSMNGMKLKQLYIIFPMLVGLAVLLLIRWKINLLTLGDDEARTLGVNAGRIRFIIIVAATLITASAVSVSGMIGWVGLVVPHFCRKVIGSNYHYLMPASMLLGAAFLILVDDVSRNLLATEIPIGILTAAVGVPFFIYLLCRKDKT